MRELLFISGFLGAGKTTFLKEFIKDNKQKRLNVIVNEFGKVGIDGSILNELEVEINEISNGSVLCSCKIDKFIETLKKSIESNCDLIIVEASGFTDTSNLKNIISSLNIKDDVKFLGDICIVDATRFLKLYNTAVVVKKQVQVADKILINKCDKVSKEILDNIKKCVYNNNSNAEIYEGNFGKFNNIKFEEEIYINEIEKSSIFQSVDLTLKKYNIKIKEKVRLIEIEQLIKTFIKDSDRVKGFIKCKDDIYYIDCVGESYSCNIYNRTIKEELLNNIVVLGSAGLKTRAKIKEALVKYTFAELE